MKGIREFYVSEGKLDDYFDSGAMVVVKCYLPSMLLYSLLFAAAHILYLARKYPAGAKSLLVYLSSVPKGYHLNDGLYFLCYSYLPTLERCEGFETLTELARKGTNHYWDTVHDILLELTYHVNCYDEAAAAFPTLFYLTTTVAAC